MHSILNFWPDICEALLRGDPETSLNSEQPLPDYSQSNTWPVPHLRGSSWIFCLRLRKHATNPSTPEVRPPTFLMRGSVDAWLVFLAITNSVLSMDSERLRLSAGLEVTPSSQFPI